MTARLAVLAAALTVGCHTRPARWDAYVDAGPLPVRGASRAAEGPTILRSLDHDPPVHRLIAANGEPETLEVVTLRGGERRIVLTYRAARGGRGRRIQLRPPSMMRVATAPEHSHAPAAPAAPASSGTPTARQSLECPIDPQRAACRAFCARSPAYEWCR
jgi:hypothetical protein